MAMSLACLFRWLRSLHRLRGTGTLNGVTSPWSSSAGCRFVMYLPFCVLFLYVCAEHCHGAHWGSQVRIGGDVRFSTYWYFRYVGTWTQSSGHTSGRLLNRSWFQTARTWSQSFSASTSRLLNKVDKKPTVDSLTSFPQIQNFAAGYGLSLDFDSSATALLVKRAMVTSLSANLQLSSPRHTTVTIWNRGPLPLKC